MQAVVRRQYGSPDVLELQEVETPAPTDDEVLVKVHAVSINSWDWDLLRGWPFPGGLGSRSKPRHSILGCDIAGRVQALGDNARHFRVGDEVFGDISGSWGGFAEFVCAHQDLLAPKPAGMTFEQVAAVPQAGVLALQGLHHRGPMREGQKVLINGAGGGVGTFAMQIAKNHGAEVTCVDRAEKLELLRSIGADHVINYRQHDFTKTGARYDLILDVVGRHSVFELKRALAPKGVYVMVGGSIGRLLQVLLTGPLLGWLSGKKLGILMHRKNRKDLESLGKLCESGAISPVIDHRFGLAAVPDGLRALGQGRVTGKVVITVAAAEPRSG